MNAVEIEEAICELVDQPFDADEFPYAFLEAFGNPEPTIKRLRKGDTNRTDVDGAVLQRSNIHILVAQAGEVENGLKALRESPKTVQQKAKFILVTDGDEFQVEDLKSGDVLACQFDDLPKHVGFLLPLAGISTVEEIKNNPIDIKATGRLDKLYVALLEKNPEWAKQENREHFNHFMAQLIFCFFAEDTGIFRSEGLFTSTVRQMSDSDGRNTHEVITSIFEAMNLDPRINGEREGVRPYADGFPYVNGGLFSGDVKVPEFSRIARTYLLRAGELDWTAINPDIFGSMIQAVADDEERGELGMHYTSVPNILKVLNPLFLDSLNEDLEKAGNNKQQLGKLKKRLAHIRVFDPACGSGNFLVIAYKKMREIEHRANIAGGWAEQIGDVDGEPQWSGQKTIIPLTNFRGIEIKSFAAEIARLALIIAEYQSDELYLGQREALALFLPLEKQNWIKCGNALRLNWTTVCPPPGQTHVAVISEEFQFEEDDQADISFENEGSETYVCGNPPYKGSKSQTSEQKNDLKRVFEPYTSNWKSLDYVSGWFMKSALYLSDIEGSSAFVSTNSVCQGVQVPILWPLIFRIGHKITFAHTSFKWKNLATHNAGVIVAIVAFSRQENSLVKLFSMNDQGETKLRTVGAINAYLAAGNPIEISQSRSPISGLSYMDLGNMPKDGGGLVFEADEMKLKAPSEFTDRELIKDFVGSQEFTKGFRRKCLWINENQVELAKDDPFVTERLEIVKKMRLSSAAASTREYADRAYRFKQIQGVAEKSSIIVPKVTSENRPYLPVGFLDASTIISDNAFALYDAPLWNMALIASKLQLVWIATVCGKLKTDYRYSNTLGWNTFPVPQLTSQHKEDLTQAAENILLAREAHFPATIADLYKPDEMPDNLRAAHDENDRILEEIYIGRRFKNDTERLEKLFEMYTEMTNNKTNQ